MTPSAPLEVSSMWGELSGQVEVVLVEALGRSGELVESSEVVVIEVEPVVVDLVEVIMGKELGEGVQVEVELVGLGEAEVRAGVYLVVKVKRVHWIAQFEPTVQVQVQLLL